MGASMDKGSRAEESQFRFMVVAKLEFELVKKRLEMEGVKTKSDDVYKHMSDELYAPDKDGNSLGIDTIKKYSCRYNTPKRTKQLNRLRRSATEVSNHISTDVDHYSDDHFNEICERVFELREAAPDKVPYQWFSEMVRAVLVSKEKSWKANRKEFQAPCSVSLEALASLEFENGQAAEYSVKELVASLVYLSDDARRLSWSCPALPRSHVLPMRRAEKDGLLKSLSPTKRPLVVVRGAAGTGRNSFADELAKEWKSAGRVSSVFECVFDVDAETTLASAVAGKRVRTDERGREKALAALSGTSWKNGHLLLLRDIPSEKLKEVLRTVDAAKLAVGVIATVVCDEDDCKSGISRMGESTETELYSIRLRTWDEGRLASLAEKCLGICGGKALTDGPSAIGEILKEAKDNVKLLEVAALAIGYSGATAPTLAAFTGETEPEKRLGAILRSHPDDRVAQALSLLSLFSAFPTPVSVLQGFHFPSPLTVCHLVDYRLARITSQDRGGAASFALDGELVRRTAKWIITSMGGEERAGFLDDLESLLDHLWGLTQGDCGWDELGAVISYYENAIGLIVSLGEGPRLENELSNRLARLYRKAGMTWHELVLRGHMLELVIPSPKSAGADSGRAEVMNALLEYGRLQTTYGSREEAAKTFETGLKHAKSLAAATDSLKDGGILSEADQATMLALAKLYRQYGWCLHEIWKRDGEKERGDTGHLVKAIEAKREAAELFNNLNSLCAEMVEPLELQKAYSTLAYSLVEIENNYADAVEYARLGVKALEDGYGISIAYVPKKGSVVCGKAPAGLRGEDLAEALYFYGRVLAGGEHPSIKEGVRTEGTLRKALAYELKACEIRKEAFGPRAMTNMSIAYNHDSLGLIYEVLGMLDEAKRHSRAAYRIHGQRFHYLRVNAGDGINNVDSSVTEIGEAPKDDPIVVNYRRIGCL